jgi:hypothetical protein
MANARDRCGKNLARLSAACPQSLVPLVFSPMRDVLIDDSSCEENLPIMVGS